MKKVLFALGEWGNGGIERLIVIYSKVLCAEGYQVDVFAYHNNPSVYDEVLQSMKVRLISPDIEIRSGYIKKNIDRVNALLSIAAAYDIVHYHTSFGMAYYHIYRLKKINPYIKVILHAHGDNVNPPHLWVKKIAHYILKNSFADFVDYGFACSQKSAKWMFPKSILKNRYTLLKNATELEQFQFNVADRGEIRRKYGLQNDFVVGTVGRFDYQKNPEFILNIIDALIRSDTKIRFIWIGDGEEREEIVLSARRKGIEPNIVFIRSTNEVEKYLSAMDVFVLPSRFEGLGIVLLEAQANGLYCIASSSLPKESMVTDRISYLDITEAAESHWKEKILSFRDVKNDRRYPRDEIKKAGYDMEEMLAQFIKVYRSLAVA